MKLKKNGIAAIHAVALAMLPWTASPGAHAQEPIRRFVVGLPAGGSFDTVARIIADKLAPETGQTIIVDNRPGAQTRIAAQWVKTAPPDGNTLLVAPGVAMFLYPHLFKRLSYSPLSDYTPVTQLVSWNLVLAVGSDSPIKSFAEFVAWSKAHPGKAFYGTSGAGSLQHLLGVSLAERTGIALEHVGFKGGKEAVTALAGGHVNAIVMDIAEVVAMAQSGKLRILATFGPQREPSLPGTPTIRELGFSNLEASGWAALYAPAKTPAAKITQLNAAVNKVLAMPEVEKKLMDLGLRPAGGTPQQLEQLTRTEMQRWREAVVNSKFVIE